MLNGCSPTQANHFASNFVRILKQSGILLSLLFVASVAHSAISLTTTSTNTTGDFTLSWTAGGNNQFYLYKDGVQVFLGLATTHTLSNLAPGTYVYQVDGCYSQGCAYPSSYTLSNSVTVTVTSASLIELSANANLSGGDFTLSFTTGYSEYTAGVAAVYQNGSYIGKTTNATLNVVGKSVGTYSYYVRSCNPGGCHPNSNTVTVEVIKEAQQGETIYKYDALGRLVRVDDYENGLVIYEYDKAGNRKAVVY
jgi:YD repeat-containing protein